MDVSCLTGDPGRARVVASYNRFAYKANRLLHATTISPLPTPLPSRHRHDRTPHRRRRRPEDLLSRGRTARPAHVVAAARLSGVVVHVPPSARPARRPLSPRGAGLSGLRL